MSVTAAVALSAMASHPVQVYLVPLPEEEVLVALQALDTSGTPLSGDTTIRTVVGITVTQTGTIIFYDQWENDFEIHINDPDDLYSAGNPGGTQIWGDGDTTNGVPPGIPSDLINAGDVITLDNNVPSAPRNPANIFFDGGDKLATTWPIAVTRAAWPVPNTGTVVAGAVEVFPTRDWGTTFQAPGGENLAVSCTTIDGTDDTANFCMFQDSRLLIMAAEDGTQVSIDVDGDGNDDISHTLDEGEGATVDGIQAGSTVTATAPVQINELTGDVGARFEARWFALVPVDGWDDSYLAPVGTVNGTDAGRTANAAVVLFNPHATDLTVNIFTPGVVTPVTVPAGGVYKFVMPGPVTSTGAGFTSDDGRTFFALGLADDERTTYDWGHTVLPETSLSIDLKVGWAPGSDGTENSSPVWITARSATTVCADYDDDGNPDQTFALTPYQSLKIYDPDGDQTGMRVFSTEDDACDIDSPKDGALLAAAWGQDPSTASVGNPALDLGTTVLQVPPIILAKEGALAVDINGNGLIDPGDALRYSLSVLNAGTATATVVVISDTLDPYTAYVLNTTELDGASVPDDNSPATAFPLDEGGVNIGDLGPGERAEIEFLVELDPDLPAGVETIVNQAFVTAGTGESSDDSASAPVFDGNPRVQKLSNVSDSVEPGGVITYTIAPGNTTPELQTNVQVTDSIPSYATYVGGSASPPQDAGPDPLVWNLGSNLAGTPGSVIGGYYCGGVVDLPAIQDTFIDQDHPTDDKGTDGTLKTNPDAADSKEKRALYQFDLSSIPSGASIASAALTITSRNSRSNHLADLKRMTTAWSATANWNTTNGTTSWVSAGGDFDSTELGTLTPVGGDAQQTADITSLVQDWVDGTLSNFGVILDPSGSDNGDADWSSMDEGDESRRPFVRAFYTFTSPGGCPSTVQVQAAADTFIKQDKPNEDRGTDSTLLTNPDAVGSDIKRALYKFDLDSLPSGAIIDSATLTITSRNTRSNHLADVKRITTFWSETANWNSPWTTPGGDFSSVVLGTLTPVGGDSQQTADITALVEDWVDGTLANFGIILDPRGSDTGDAQWSSREEGDESRRPFIEISYRSPTVLRTLPITQDTYIEEDDPTKDRSTANPVLTRPETAKINRALFQFEVGSVPSGATVTSAALAIQSNNTRSGDFADVKRITTGWTETANWNTTDGATAWGTPGGDFAVTALATLVPDSTRQQANITSLVQDWIDDTFANYGVILDPHGVDDGDAQWESREDGDTTRHPSIDVEYVAASLGSSTTTTLAADSLATDGGSITVTMSLTSTGADTNVTPGALNISGTGGAGAACGAPSPASQGIPADTPISFTWTCTANAGATPGSVTFSADAAGSATSFATATSNSVLVSPLLTFQVMVDSPLDRNVTTIVNTAELSNDQSPDPSKSTVVDAVSIGANIGDSVWLDTDGDGIQDIGEDGLPNVVVELRDGVCTPGVDCPTTTTGAAGNYLFAYLPPGTYTVAVLSGLHPGLRASPGNSGGVSDPITVIGSEQVLTADFGYTAPDGIGGWGLIGNFVWSDADGDGVQDPGEPGIDNVTVELLGPGPDGILGTADDVVVAVTSTAPDGQYLLGAFAAGQYQVVVTDGGGWLSGYTPTSGPQSEGGYVSVPVTVALGDVISDVDFGFDNDSLFSIHDMIWVDGDGDGVRDAGEEGIAGVTVNLRNALLNIIATTVTDASGDFSFDGLADNSKYLVEIADTTGQLAGLAGTTAPAQVRQLGVGIEGADFVGTNFGYSHLSAFFGAVWNDADSDGMRDEGEIGLGGVTIELRDSSCTPATDCPTTVTAADGSYTFRGLEPELYTVAVTDTDSVLTTYVQTGDPDEPGACSICDGLSTAVVTLTTGHQYLDFGYRDSSLDDVSGTIFDDANADGVEDPGESGLVGVTVELLDDSGNVIGTATTNASGDYVFPELPAGSYAVRVTDQASVLDGFSLTSGLDELPVQAGDSDADFGYTRRSGTASIGDRLWLDVDGDGLAGPNEAGLAGVTADLWQDTDGDGVLNAANDTLVATTTTDANGDYVFGALEPGNYFVDVDEATLPVSSPGDLVETTYPVGVNPSAVIALSAAQDFNDADFGYVPASGTAVLGDRVWYDSDGDGLQDRGEVGIGGVDIKIIGPGCSPTACTFTTNPDGTWLATGLAAGDYVVKFDAATLPAGYGVIPTNLGGDDTFNVTLIAGDVFTQLDFGFGGGTTATIGERIWLDANGDGIEDPGEAGLAGVTVNLVNVGGYIFATTFTDEDGEYIFAGVPDGAYTVEVSDIDGVLVGLHPTGDPDEVGVCTTCDLQASVTVSGGVGPSDIDFGLAPSGGTGTVGDFVWRDVNGNGLQDSGEPGVEGVTLELWHDVDADGVITPGVDNLVRTAATDRNGRYEFTSLPDGDYVVRVTDRAGVMDEFDQTGDPDEAGPCSVCDNEGTFTLSGGSGDFDQDFGYAAPVGLAFAISGTIFEDQDRDGAFDDPVEPGVQGARVSLFSDLDGDGALGAGEPLLGSTSSDLDGNYSFIDLAPGDYLVAVDVDGTAVDGYVQTTQSATGGIEPVTITSDDEVDRHFGFWNGGLITTPVTLAYFKSEGGGTVTFEWATATETGNLGFHLYVLEGDGLRRLNETIIPSHLGDALTPQHYSLEAWDVEGSEFYIEDVDILGRNRFHGPFELGRTYGSRVLDVKRTDWAGIREEHRKKTATRLLSSPLSSMNKGLNTGSASSSISNSKLAVNLRVSEDGIYRVTYESLKAAGIDLGRVKAAHLALLNGGKPIPMRVEGFGASFGSGSFIEFVGEALDTLYTRTNVYSLIIAPRHALRVGRDARSAPSWTQPPDFYVETRTVETNRSYHFAAPGEDPWFDTRLLATAGPVETSVDLELEDRFEGAGPVELTVALWGVTDFPMAPDHHVVLEVNGFQMADEWFDGLENHPIQMEIPDWLLEPQNNVLRVQLPHDTGALYDLVHYDSYQVEYPRQFRAREGRLSFTAADDVFRVDDLPSADIVVYRISDERVEIVQRVRISGSPGTYSATFVGSERPATYYVETVDALRVPQAEPAPPSSRISKLDAEFLIISHPDFIEDLEPFVNARRSQGFSVEVVDVEEIYAQFSYGVFDPQAIRAYIRRAYRKMGTEYVLLVGGDTYDYLDYLGLGTISFIPTLYTRTDPIVHYAPVDPLYGDIDRDGVPDVAIGRWPVRTTAELNGMIEKTLDYGSINYTGTAVLAADAYDVAYGYSFSEASNDMLGSLPVDWQVAFAYLDDLELPEARQVLIDEINYGVALTNYVGHSGPTAWSFERLFDTRDADALDNTYKPTIVTQWGCWNNYHVEPTFDSLGQRFLLNPDRGASAVLGAATLTEAASELKLAKLLFSQLGGERQPLGRALLRAKKILAINEPDKLDVLLGWTLLGDPTLMVEP